MRLEVHSEARAEFLHAVSFYNARVPGLGLRFIAEIERCQKVLLETPLVGHPYGRRLRKFVIHSYAGRLDAGISTDRVIPPVSRDLKRRITRRAPEPPALKEIFELSRRLWRSGGVYLPCAIECAHRGCSSAYGQLPEGACRGQERSFGLHRQ